MSCKDVANFLSVFDLLPPPSNSCCTFEDGNSRSNPSRWELPISIGCTNMNTGPNSTLSTLISSININLNVTSSSTNSCKMLSPFIPASILQPLQNITGLTIRGCDLSAANISLVDDIAVNLKRLTYLNLSNSQIHSQLSNVGLLNFKSLEVLDLSSNALFGFMPTSLSMLSLSFLNVSGNAFTSPLPYWPASSNLASSLKTCDLGYGCYPANGGVPQACQSELLFGKFGKPHPFRPPI